MKNKETITITLVGPSGSGRSTLAYLIEHTLRKAGIEVNRVDPEVKTEWIPEFDNLNSIAKNTSVSVHPHKELEV